MRFVFPVALLLAGCASVVTTSLPLHEEKIVVPSSVGRKYAVGYVRGYEAAWVAYLKVYATDIDHKREFLEDVASGDPIYTAGWFAGRDDFEVLVRHLIAASGRDAAKAELAAALKGKTPNQ